MHDKRTKRVKNMETFLGENVSTTEKRSLVDKLEWELEFAYSWEIKDLETKVEPENVKVYVLFADLFEGEYEIKKGQTVADGHIGEKGINPSHYIAKNKGTREEEDVRNILIDFCERNLSH